MKNYKDEDYKRGIKHGNEGKYAHPSGILDNLGGKSYVAGKEFAYRQRIKNPPRNPPKKAQKSSRGGGGGYSGGGGIGGIVIGIAAVVLILFIIGAIAQFKHPPLSSEQIQDLRKTYQAEEKQKIDKTNQFKASLPAGLTRDGKNYIEIYNQAGEIYIPFNDVVPPDTTYHIYNLSMNSGNDGWVEVPIENRIIQQMNPSGEWRVILYVKQFMSFGSASSFKRTIVTWDKPPQGSAKAVQRNEQSSLEPQLIQEQRNLQAVQRNEQGSGSVKPQHIQERQNLQEVRQHIRNSNNGRESNFRNNPSHGFDSSGL